LGIFIIAQTYNITMKEENCFVIAIAGSSGAGKTEVNR